MFCRFVLCILHFIWYMLLSLYLSFCGCCLRIFCIVFRVLNVIFILVSLNNFVIFLVSFPLCVNVVHFGFRCCESVLLFCFCFCEAGCFINWFMLYLLLCSVLFIMCSGRLFLSSLQVTIMWNYKESS
jgi:hypothetical protein